MDQSPDASFVDSWPTHLAAAALSGVITTHLPVHRWSPRARWVLHGGMGALAGGGMALLLRRAPHGGEDQPGPDDGGERVATKLPVGPVRATGIAVAFGILVATVSRGGQAADEWCERTLSARGVRRPRAWMGAVAAGASLAMSVADERGNRRPRQVTHPA